MYHVSAQGVDERMINVHYYYYRFRIYAPLKSNRVLTADPCTQMFSSPPPPTPPTPHPPLPPLPDTVHHSIMLFNGLLEVFMQGYMDRLMTNL